MLFPLLCSTADTSSYQTSPQAVAESADERSSQRETGYHPQECDLGRYSVFGMHSPRRIFAIITTKKNHICVLIFCASRPGRGGVQQHGGGLHETCVGCGRPAAKCRSQRHHLQWAAGPHSRHHGCVLLSTGAVALLVSMASDTYTNKSESLQDRSCGLKG